MADDEVIDKLSNKCDEECNLEKRKSFGIIDQLASELKRQVEESTTNYQEFKEEYDEDIEIKVNLSYNVTTPLDIDNTHQEFLRRHHLAVEYEKVGEKVKSKLRTIENGIRSISKTELVIKTSTALKNVLEAVEKFATQDPIKVMMGVAEVVNAIENCLQPPTSLTTEDVLDILGIFVGGGPTSEHIVKFEFQMMQTFAEEQILKQKAIWPSEMEDLKDEVLTASKSQIDALHERLAYLDRGNYIHSDTFLALSLKDMKFLMETDDVLAIRDNFEDICLKLEL